MTLKQVNAPAPLGELTLGDFRDLVADASPRTLTDLARASRVYILSPRDLLVHQGEQLEVHVVLEGWLAVRRNSPEGRAYTLDLLRPGAVMGIQSAWRNGPAMFDIVALTPARVASLPGPAIRAIAERDSALAIRLFDLAMGGTMGIAERMDGAVFDVARKRLAKTLLTYEPLISGSPPIVSRADLAGLIETSREMLGNAIRALEAEGVIRREGRRIVIRNRPALEREADLVGPAAAQDRWFGAVEEHWAERRQA